MIYITRKARFVLYVLIIIVVAWKIFIALVNISTNSPEFPIPVIAIDAKEELQVKTKSVSPGYHRFIEVQEENEDLEENGDNAMADLWKVNELGQDIPRPVLIDVNNHEEIEGNSKTITSRYHRFIDQEQERETSEDPEQERLTFGEVQEMDMAKLLENNQAGMPNSNSIKASSSCTPHKHIMFLKTHKCASSTVQNIFLRYGYQHNLTFALGTGHYLGSPAHFKYKMLNQALLPPSGRADIFTLHTRLNIPEHQKAVHPDAKWITLVREPAEQFESLYSYYLFQNVYHMDLKTFLKQPVEKLRIYPRKPPINRQGKNTVLFDLGYPDAVSEENLKKVISQMDNTFHLVMISDKMDEALILMRHLLCWEIKDIVTFSKNARIKGKDLSAEEKLKIHGMNREDTAIYNHFLQKHNEMVEDFGREEMAKEVSELQNLRKEYFDICVREEVKGHDKRLENKEWSGNVNAFLPSKNGSETCQMIMMGEVPFVGFVRQKQKKLLLGL